MHAEVVLLLEELRNGVGDAADAELDAGPVRHIAGDEAAYAHVLLVGGRVGDDGDGVARLYKVVHLGAVYDVVAVDEGVVGVYLEYRDVRGLHHAALIGVGGGQGDIAVLVGHRGGADVDVRLVAVEPLGGGQVEMVGDEGHVALLVGAAHGGRVKPAVHGEGVRIFGLVKLAGVRGVAVYYLDALDAARQGVDVLHEEPRLACAEAGDHDVAALD